MHILASLEDQLTKSPLLCLALRWNPQIETPFNPSPKSPKICQIDVYELLKLETNSKPSNRTWKFCKEFKTLTCISKRATLSSLYNFNSQTNERSWWRIWSATTLLQTLLAKLELSMRLKKGRRKNLGLSSLSLGLKNDGMNTVKFNPIYISESFSLSPSTRPLITIQVKWKLIWTVSRQMKSC